MDMDVDMNIDTEEDKETESRIEALEAELAQTKDELRKILLDIRAYLMEMQTPIPKNMNKDGLQEELEVERG